MQTKGTGMCEEGPKAPRDAQKKRSGFYLMRGKDIAGSIQPDGRGIQFLHMDGERMITAARIVGNVAEEGMLELLKSAAGFRRLVHSMGVRVEMAGDFSSEDCPEVDFVLQMYPGKDSFVPGTQIKASIPTDGMEYMVELDDYTWSDNDNVPGQIRFEFSAAGQLAQVWVKLYLRDGFQAPEETEEAPVDLEAPEYRELVKKSLMQAGNPARLQKALAKARRGEDTTIAFIGGSITQGAGAIPINTSCYAYKTFQKLCRLAGKGMEENIHYVKAGVGGTPSELGMLRYHRDVCRDGAVEPDIVVVEFAVNDLGDETQGECYDSLVRMILGAKNAPAVILLFAVFASDWNLQERLAPVGEAYDLPMVSVRDAVVEQFYKKPGAGRLFGKSQFFYDCYHPTNLGHTVMADCIGYLLETADGMPEGKDDLRLDRIVPPLGGEFENVRLYDRNSKVPGISVDCGSFCGQDQELHAVEMNMDLTQTPEFPYNWMHGQNGDSVVMSDGSSKAADASCKPAGASKAAPFSMDITCTALVLIYKDSGSGSVGCADVFVDGKKVLTADPHVGGWTHCNPVICFRGGERRKYHVEISMAAGDEDKEFTILGFGYVE